MDILLIIAQFTLGMLGVLGVATSYPSLWLGQLSNVFIGLGIVLIVSRIKPRFIVRASPWIYFSVIILLVAVLFFGISPDGSAAKRWLSVGPYTLQPSEFMKIAVITYLAGFFYNHAGNWRLWKPMVIVGFAAGLILLEPNFSTALFLFALAFTIMVAAGSNWQRLASVSAVAAIIATLVFGLAISQYPYMMDRILAFTDFHGAQERLLDTGFQTNRAAILIQQAGFFGLGAGLPILHLPEPHTDMVSIAIARVLGSTGIATLIIMYLVIAGRGIRIATQQSGPASLLAAGATAYICGQAALNLLVASGLLPVTGVVLPFVSHGLNNLLSVSIAMGFIHGAYRLSKATGEA